MLERRPPVTRPACESGVAWRGSESALLRLDSRRARGPCEARHGDVSSLRRDLGDVLGSVRIGVGHLVVEPGKLTYPPHCHSAEEELFVVLEGSGALLLGDDEHPVRPGTVVARPPATGVAHAFRAGDVGLTLLAFGTREPNDIAYFPRSGKVSLRGIGVKFRVEPLGYWDGE
jgi:uncharacterized cupin superfamily protein